MSATDWMLEGVKLAGQLGGALAVSYITVRLALRRYKQERLWDKRLQVYSDLVEALSEMYRTDSILLQHEYDGHDESEAIQKYEAELVERFNVAKRKVESTAATAKLILTKDVEIALDDYFAGIQAARDAETYSDHLELECATILKARNAVLELGRKSHNP